MRSCITVSLVLLACGQPSGYCVDASAPPSGAVRAVGNDTDHVFTDRLHTSPWTCRVVSRTLGCTGAEGSFFNAKFAPYIGELYDGAMWSPLPTALFQLALYETRGGTAVSVNSTNSMDTIKVYVARLPTSSQPGEVVITGDMCNDDSRYPSSARFSDVHAQLVVQ